MMVANKRLIGSMFVAVVAGVVAAQPAWAVGTARAKYTGNPTSNTDLTGHITDGTIHVWGDGLPITGITGKGGIYVLELDTASVDTNGDGDSILTQPVDLVYSFCIDLPQDSDSNFHVFDVELPRFAPVPPLFGAPMGLAKETYLRELWALYFSPTMTGADAEAMSAAIWEIIYEDLPSDPSGWSVSLPLTPDGDGTSFRATQLNAATANAMLHSLDGAGPLANLRALTDPDFQDFLVEIPEPASLALMGVGSAFMLYRRRGS